MVEVKKGMSEKEIENYVNDVLKHMSLEDKIDQMRGNGLFIKVVEDKGFGKRAYDAAGSKKFNIPPFKFTDGPRGVINYSSLKVEVTDDKIIATVDIKNTGIVVGDEVVQLYIGLEESQIDRPVKLLKGFSRVHLIPNETKTVKIEVLIKNLAWYNPESKSWEIEQMKYTLYMGASSRKEDLLSIQFII